MALASKPLRILVVGQTPPPFGGQAVMIDQFLKGRYDSLRLFHVRLAFSQDMESVGRFGVGKVFILMTTIVRIWWARLRYRTAVLYYPPAGPNLVPVLRDIILLCATRWLFKRVVFHFHASGVSEFRTRLARPLRPFFRMAYGRPTLAIRTARENPDDGEVLDAKDSVVIPNGVEDWRGRVPERTAGPGTPVVILFTGVLIASKGVRVLLEAFARLRATGHDARLELMGKWGDATFEAECLAYVREQGLGDRVEWLGVLRDAQKFSRFAACDIFCFPSYFEAESFGLVLLEAMQFAKPVVSTRWRGIPSVVEDGRNGLLVPIRSPEALADALARSIQDPAARKAMGEEGRRIFEERFTLQRFQHAMERALASLQDPK